MSHFCYQCEIGGCGCEQRLQESSYATDSQYDHYAADGHYIAGSTTNTGGQNVDSYPVSDEGLYSHGYNVNPAVTYQSPAADAFGTGYLMPYNELPEPPQPMQPSTDDTTMRDAPWMPPDTAGSGLSPLPILTPENRAQEALYQRFTSMSMQQHDANEAPDTSSARRSSFANLRTGGNSLIHASDQLSPSMSVRRSIAFSARQANANTTTEAFAFPRRPAVNASSMRRGSYIRTHSSASMQQHDGYPMQDTASESSPPFPAPGHGGYDYLYQGHVQPLSRRRYSNGGHETHFDQQKYPGDSLSHILAGSQVDEVEAEAPYDAAISDEDLVGTAAPNTHGQDNRAFADESSNSLPQPILSYNYIPAGNDIPGISNPVPTDSVRSHSSHCVDCNKDFKDANGYNTSNLNAMTPATKSSKSINVPDVQKDFGIQKT
ncbi:hypothetical protein EJ06DRAFT_261158 [Trichodelitschia bisporula]|uniref:Uncharacterized protein n=1 Tax=Trichodelitschia bisporula TaxID=703511 RepID=A0A6G1HIA4_9PEZI|nr:hypothetical protein EJ06DRAFT_261158 [Trichodelitschia bisporula]